MSFPDEKQWEAETAVECMYMDMYVCNVLYMYSTPYVCIFLYITIQYITDMYLTQLILIVFEHSPYTLEIIT